MLRISYVKTVVGWRNIYLLDGSNQMINVSPERFAELFPRVSPKIAIGGADISVGQAVDIGFNVELPEAVAV